MGKQYLIDRKWLTDAEAKNFISEKIRNINSFYSGRLKLTFDLLEIKSGMKVLDVGCHLGFVDYYLAKSNPSAEFYGVDIVPDFIELANKYVRLPNLSYDTQDILNNNFKDNTFDYVLFLETIEHVANPAAYASEFLRILKPGGCLVLSTPNAIGITNVLHNLKHMNDVKKIEDEARNTGTETDHIYCWDKRTLFRLLNRAGFRYVSHKTHGLFSIRRGQSIVMKVQKPTG